MKPSIPSNWKNGFLFVGNQPALDFLNTRPVIDEAPNELIPDFGALLRWFRAAELLSQKQADDLQRKWSNSPKAEQMTRAARKLREKLREEIIAWERGDEISQATIDELNRLMARHPMRTRLKGKGSAFTELWFEAGDPEDLFAPLAYNFAMLFAHVDRSRVRMCDQCVLHFVDTSKKGTRRWCSMQLCGNRLKVAAYAQRQRAKAD